MSRPQHRSQISHLQTQQAQEQHQSQQQRHHRRSSLSIHVPSLVSWFNSRASSSSAATSGVGGIRAGPGTRAPRCAESDRSQQQQQHHVDHDITTGPSAKTLNTTIAPAALPSSRRGSRAGSVASVPSFVGDQQAFGRKSSAGFSPFGRSRRTSSTASVQATQGLVVHPPISQKARPSPVGPGACSSDFSLSATAISPYLEEVAPTQQGSPSLCRCASDSESDTDLPNPLFQPYFSGEDQSDLYASLDYYDVPTYKPSRPSNARRRISSIREDAAQKATSSAVTGSTQGILRDSVGSSEEASRVEKRTPVTLKDNGPVSLAGPASSPGFGLGISQVTDTRRRLRRATGQVTRSNLSDRISDAEVSPVDERTQAESVITLAPQPSQIPKFVRNDTESSTYSLALTNGSEPPNTPPLSAPNSPFDPPTFPNPPTSTLEGYLDLLHSDHSSQIEGYFSTHSSAREDKQPTTPPTGESYLLESSESAIVFDGTALLDNQNNRFEANSISENEEEDGYDYPITFTPYAAEASILEDAPHGEEEIAVTELAPLGAVLPSPAQDLATNQVTEIIQPDVLDPAEIPLPDSPAHSTASNRSVLSLSTPPPSSKHSRSLQEDQLVSWGANRKLSADDIFTTSQPESERTSTSDDVQLEGEGIDRPNPITDVNTACSKPVFTELSIPPVQEAERRVSDFVVYPKKLDLATHEPTNRDQVWQAYEYKYRPASAGLSGKFPKLAKRLSLW